MSDDEIEFLDEDADIVQQCVQSAQLQLLEPKTEPIEDEEPPPHVIPKLHKSQFPVLIERPSPVTATSTAKKRKKEEDDIDYDPMVDSPYRNRRRRHQRAKPSNIIKYESTGRGYEQRRTPFVSNIKVEQGVQPPHINRRTMTIRIPDYDDPLCLPVRALVKDVNDSRRLRHWNRACLEQFKKNDVPLRPRIGPATSSKRTVVIRNLPNKYSGKTETTFWSKTSVQSEDGGTRAEVVQSVLPRYREKKVLSAYKLREATQRPTSYRSEVILTKEKYGEEETLVAYKPDESLSMVLKMFEGEGKESSEENKRYLQEVASCTACAPCYQTSWRGNETDDTRAIVRARCGVCSRVCVSAPALLAHAKTHPPAQRARARRDLSHALAKMLPYHYRCRICQDLFPGIRDLRKHVRTHRDQCQVMSTGSNIESFPFKIKSLGKFYCEVGNHYVT